MSDALAKLIRQAEQQKLEIQLHLRYQKNLALFKERFPQAYKKLVGHHPTKWMLKLDPNDQINLVDLEEKRYLYNEIPSEYAGKLIKAFKQNTQVRKFRVVKNNEQNPKHLHIQGLNALIDEYQSKTIPHIKGTPHYLSNLIITGIGLGYHLLEAIKAFDIQNVFIYERSIDVLHASLHTIDWQSVVDHFKQHNKTISLCVGVEPIKALAQIENAINSVGLHSQIFSFVLRHSERDCENEFIETYFNEIRSFIGGLGYFDDERIGLAHAYHNLKSKHAVFVSDKAHNRITRAVIIGNGPSLDMHEQYLKQYKDDMVLVSCGTALTSLIRMGIKPDFHVEMERPSFIEDVINFGTTQEQRDGICLLCLHTVSPRTIACFNEACYAIKPNDAGNALVHEFTKHHNARELPFSNPTVTNCALSFLVSMGFKDIHLVGVDLGTAVSAQHHSSKSIYYDFEKADKTGRTIQIQNYKEREGNFGGIVHTSPVLDMSRSSMERLLAHMCTTFKDFKCYNTNNGVKIDNTFSVTLDDLPTPTPTDKLAEITDIKTEHFYHPKTKKLNDKRLRNLLKNFVSVKEKIKLPLNINTEKELLMAMTEAYTNINKIKNITTHYLLRGTLSCYFGAITENCLYCENEKDFISRVKLGTSAYNQLVDNIYLRMENNPTEIDDTVNPQFNKFISVTEEQK